MRGRESRFPERGPLITRRGQAIGPRPGRKTRPVFPWLVLGVVVWLAGDRFDWDFETLNGRLVEEFDEHSMPVQVPTEPGVLIPSPIEDVPAKEPADTEPVGSGAAIDVTIPIGKGFRPVGFQVAARPHDIPLSETPGPLLHRLPRFDGPSQAYGVLRLNRGQHYSLALDLQSEQALLYIDRNRNGDLRDDGPPVENQGNGYFSGRFDLSLAQVSGVRRLQGNYSLWLFLNQDGSSEWKLRHYSTTQLRGRMLLSGDSHDVWLADNRVLDADYRNDGLYIDLDKDGKIQPRREYLPPGAELGLNGQRYRFSVER